MILEMMRRAEIRAKNNMHNAFDTLKHIKPDDFEDIIEDISHKTKHMAAIPKKDKAATVRNAR